LTCKLREAVDEDLDLEAALEPALERAFFTEGTYITERTRIAFVSSTWLATGGVLGWD